MMLHRVTTRASGEKYSREDDATRASWFVNAPRRATTTNIFEKNERRMQNYA
ncbi:MAG TPA: hypothetical protein VJL29_14790 [Thermoguttaceae bacterium]|nr:hypothetical protein [Thermoguttaceae bacterium]